MKKNRFAVLFAVIPMVCMLTGCGSTNPKTEEGMKQVSSFQYASALELFDEAEGLGENERLIARGRGIAYLGQSMYEKAIDSFLLSLALSDGFVQDVDYDINYYLADAYLGAQRYEDAEEVYSSIIDLKDDAQAYYLRGNARILQGSYTMASEDFKKAMSLEPKNTGMLINIYLCLADNGYKDAGMEYLQNTLANADRSMTALDKGKINFYMGEYQIAAASLEEARSQDNDNSDANLYLGRAYEAVGEYNYASNVYENYLARNTQDAAVYNQLATCRMKMGDYEGALDCIQLGMQTGDKAMLKALSFNEIVAYEYLGEFQSAKALMKSYLESYPGDEEALREEIFLQTR